MFCLVKLFVSFVGLFTAALVCWVFVLIWTIPDKPMEHGTSFVCLPVSMTTTDQLQCGTSQVVLHRYLNRKFAEVNQQILDKEKENIEKGKRSTSYLIETTVYRKTPTREVRRPAARLVGKTQSETGRIVDGLMPIRQWSHGRQRGGYMRYGVGYTHGRIIVPVTGVYFVYSFLSLYEPCIPDTGLQNNANTNTYIQHAIYKYNVINATYSKLMTGVQPHWTSRNDAYNQYSSYISSIVQLQAGDEVNVKVSNITYLQNPDDNYFGLYLI